MLSYFLNFMEKGAFTSLGTYSIGQAGVYPGNFTDLLSAESCPCVFLVPTFNIPL